MSSVYAHYKERLHCGYSEITYFPRVAALSSLMTSARFSRSGNDSGIPANPSQIWRKARSAHVVTWELSNDRNKLVRLEAGASNACMTRYEIAPIEFVDCCHACTGFFGIESQNLMSVSEIHKQNIDAIKVPSPT